MSCVCWDVSDYHTLVVIRDNNNIMMQTELYFETSIWKHIKLFSFSLLCGLIHSLTVIVIANTVYTANTVQFEKRTILCDPLLSQWCAGEEFKSVLLLTIESISLIMVWGNIDLKLISDNFYYFAWYSKQTFKNKQMWAWWMYLSILANTRHCPNVIPMLVHRLRNWFRIKTTLGLKVVFLGMIITNPWSNSAVQSHKAVSAYFQLSRYCLLTLQGSVIMPVSTWGDRSRR